jgi:hypothetical protein
MRRSTAARRVFAALVATALALPAGVWAQAPAEPPPAAPAELAAPNRLFPRPAVFLLLPLSGDRVPVRYTPGALDRASNLQTRLELLARAFHRWTGEEPQIEVFVLLRREWEEAGYEVPYGLPVRAGERGLAVPSEGDAGTVALWSELLGGRLPGIGGVPLRGSPQEAATMALADVLTQILAAEILVDEHGLAGDRPWLRGVMAQLVSRAFTRQFEPARLGDLRTMFAHLGHRYGPREMSARDFRPELGLRDWLWFQAQFYEGAGVLLEEEGKGAVKRMKKLRKKGGGELRADELLRRYQELDGWFRGSFSAVSLRAGG